MKGKRMKPGKLIHTRTHRVRRVLVLAALLAGLFSSWSCSDAQSANDFQTWQWLTVRLWKTNDFRLTLYGDNRMAENSSRQKLFILGPRVAQRFHPNWNVGAGYLFLNIQELPTQRWKHEHRLDFALSPSVNLAPKTQLHSRNRIELRWLERTRGAIPRARHRIQLRQRINRGPVESVYCNNEIFIDYRQGRYSENRVVPAGIGFRLHDHASIDFFYMIQSRRRAATGNWDDNHIFGAHLRVRL